MAIHAVEVDDMTACQGNGEEAARDRGIPSNHHGNPSSLASDTPDSNHQNAIGKNLFVRGSEADVVRTIVPAADIAPKGLQPHQSIDRTSSEICSEEDLTAGHGIAFTSSSTLVSSDDSHARGTGSDDSSSLQGVSQKNASKKEMGSKEVGEYMWT